MLRIVGRLAAHNALRRPTATLFFVLVVATVAVTATLAMIIGVGASSLYKKTRAATSGPDVIGVSHSVVPSNGYALFPNGQPPAPRAPGGATISPGDSAALTALGTASGVAAHLGPYPVALAFLRAGGKRHGAIAIGRAEYRSPIDQPAVTTGRWLGAAGEVVVERAFAQALDVEVRRQVILDGRVFRVVGVAVSASVPPYPDSAYLWSPTPQPNPGVVWVTEADARALASPAQPLSYGIGLRLADPGKADAFVAAHRDASDAVTLTSWTSVERFDERLLAQERASFRVAIWLLAALAAMTIGLLVGSRAGDQTRRVGTLKALGATPGLLAVVLLAEQVGLAAIATAVGLTSGWAIGPLFTTPGAGLIGVAGRPAMGPTTITVVSAIALGVAVLASVVPTVGAARTSTVVALADAPHAPFLHPRRPRHAGRVPTPLRLGIILAVRRPWRGALAAATIAVATSSIVAILAEHLRMAHRSTGLADPNTIELNRVLLMHFVVVAALASATMVLATWTIAHESARALTIARALGATRQQLADALASAQLLSAVPGVVVGVPGGLVLYAAVRPGRDTLGPSAESLVATAAAIVVALALVTVAAARVSARGSVGDVLKSEHA